MAEPRNPALILGLTATGLAAARSLSRRGVPTWGIDRKAFEVGHHSAEVRSIDFGHLPPGEALADRVAAWSRAQDRPPVLIAADDAYIDFICAHHQQLRETCLVVDGYRPEVASQFVDKRTFYRRCLELGAEVAVTLFPVDLEELAETSRTLRFPAILKPSHGHRWRERLKGKKVVEVADRDALLEAYRVFGALDTGMVVQETIPGPERSIFVGGCYVRPGGEVAALFTARKTRQFPPFFGSGSYMESEWNDEVARLSATLLGQLGYAGICGTEYKPDPRDGGRYKLIEVNPRPTLWFSLTRAAGNDIVWHAYRDLIGDPLPAAVHDQRDGVRWQYLARDILTVARYLPRGLMSARDILAFLDPRKDFAILSLRDLRGSAYYPLYLLRQWRAHRRGDAS